MYAGHLGQRFPSDPQRLGNPERERTPEEVALLAALDEKQANLRQFVAALPNDVDGRCKAAALTKLDECVMWLTRGIDA